MKKIYHSTRWGYQVNIFFYFSMKIYVMGTDQQCLFEAFLMSTITCFLGEISKISKFLVEKKKKPLQELCQFLLSKGDVCQVRRWLVLCTWDGFSGPVELLDLVTSPWSSDEIGHPSTPSCFAQLPERLTLVLLNQDMPCLCKQKEQKKPTDLDLHCLLSSIWICMNNLDRVIWLAEN